MGKRKSGVEKVILRGNGKEVELTAPGGAAAATKLLEEVVESMPAGRRRTSKQVLEDADMRAELGAGLWVPTGYRPHLLAAKKKAKEKLADEHGVSFRRVDDDCLIEAGFGCASISILLEGEGPNAPDVRTVIPARAAKLIASAHGDEQDLAELWFLGGKVIVRVGEEYHYFRVLQPDLRFPGENLRERRASPSLGSLHVDAILLAKCQKALGAESIEIRRAGKGVLCLYPNGDDTSLAMVFVTPVSAAEDDHGAS